MVGARPAMWPTRRGTLPLSHDAESAYRFVFASRVVSSRSRAAPCSVFAFIDFKHVLRARSGDDGPCHPGRDFVEECPYFDDDILRLSAVHDVSQL